MEGVIALVVLAVLAIPVLLVIALVSISTLKQRIAALEQQVDALHRRPAATGPAEPTLADLVRQSAPAPTRPTPQAPSPPQPETPAPVRATSPPPQQVREPMAAAPTPA